MQDRVDTSLNCYGLVHMLTLYVKTRGHALWSKIDHTSCHKKTPKSCFLPSSVLNILLTIHELMVRSVLNWSSGRVIKDSCLAFCHIFRLLGHTCSLKSSRGQLSATKTFFSALSWLCVSQKWTFPVSERLKDSLVSWESKRGNENLQQNSCNVYFYVCFNIMGC